MNNYCIFFSEEKTVGSCHGNYIPPENDSRLMRMFLAAPVAIHSNPVVIHRNPRGYNSSRSSPAISNALSEEVVWWTNTTRIPLLLLARIRRTSLVNEVYP